MKPSSDPGAGDLERVVVERREELVAFVRRRAGGALLRIETADDLAQGICAHALSRRDRAQGDADALRAWLFRVAENYLHDRRDHWAALKRTGGSVLRASLGESVAAELAPVRDLASSMTGPSTFAAHRELLQIAAIALDMLLPRDRTLVEGVCNGESVEAQAAQLGLSYDGTSQARVRAVDRFRRCFKLATRGRGARA